MRPLSAPNVCFLVIPRESARLGADWSKIGQSFGIMPGISSLAPWLFACIVLTAVILIVRKYFNPNARETRRRSRNHGSVVSRKRGPNIHLAVEADKKKRRRK
jgi:hypothetical protein